jgi:hypothetical protein
VNCDCFGGFHNIALKNYLDMLPPLVAASRFGLKVKISSLMFKSANYSRGRFGTIVSQRLSDANGAG